MQFLHFMVLGMGTGSIYAMVGLAVVLVFRASGVLNFATGSVGAVAAYIFFALRDQHNVNWILALVLALASGAAIGALTQVLVMSRLRHSSVLLKLIATLGVLTLLQGVMVLIWGSQQQLVEGILPITPVTISSGFVVGEDQLILIAIAIVVSIALKILYTYTSFGRATTAVAENRRVAAGFGWSTSMIEVINWSLGGALSALAAILIAPIVGLSPETLALLVLPAIAAGLVGSFNSFLLTVAGAMALGVIQSELSNYVSTTGVAASVPFLLIVVIVVAGGRARPTRGDIPNRLPLPGTGRIRLSTIAIGGAVLLSLVWTVSPLWIASINTTLIFGLIIMSVVVVTGYAGQLSLGQWAMAGLAAWIAGRLVAVQGLPFAWAALIGVVAMVPIGVVFALPALRTRGINLAVVTLGMAEAVQNIIFTSSNLTGGIDGIQVGSPHLFGINLDDTLYPARYATMTVIAFIVVAVAVSNVRRGRSGRRMLAVSGNERAAAALGINVYATKLHAFALGAAIAGIAGILTVFQTPTVVLTQFDVFGSIDAVVYAVIGGIGWVSGALLGALFGSGSVSSQALSSLTNNNPQVNNWFLLAGGLSVVLVVIQAPNGLAQLNLMKLSVLTHRISSALHGLMRVNGNIESGSGRRQQSRAHSRPQPTAALKQTKKSVELTVTGLCVQFGGVKALSDVNLQVRSGEVLGLIGPNGAGKTTLLDAVTGFNKPSGGSVVLDGRNIQTWSPVRRARAGLGRSFQGVELFRELTVLDNLLVASDDHSFRPYVLDPLHPGRPRQSSLTMELIGELELEPFLDLLPPELPYGTTRLVAIAQALVAEPKVLFLDEPAAGLDTKESAELGRVISRIARQRNVAVVVVEHDVPLVLSICDRIVVLDFGRTIAEGTPDEISADPVVREAYLGRRHHVQSESQGSVSLASSITKEGSVGAPAPY